ncbi:hypothetical protein B5E58_04070 [Tyzzerella sp. An114]|uniref:hypothetical protein n=1 Tax=Tyzzerella sp. An114 TaxID=1965545 RepID=UPI000B44BA7E|nr:hypothetical protein [Tyzzerella sp. An114]OUQ59620.1 hypothetical protein B5E58_04070 [Tyzzerella sp. An114]
MKKIYIITAVFVFIFSAVYGYISTCEFEDVKENVQIEELKTYDTENVLETSYNINKKTKDYILNLYNTWIDFKENINQNKNPENDFKNSEFIKTLKEYFSSRESLEVSIEELCFLINQRGFDYIEKNCTVNNKNYTVRVICYSANLDVQAVTDLPVKNKWVFVQIWNDEYFKGYTVSESGYNILNGFNINVVGDKINLDIELIDIVTKNKEIINYTLNIN